MRIYKEAKTEPLKFGKIQKNREPKGSDNKKTIDKLRAYFKEHISICDHLGDDGYVSNACSIFNKFNYLRDSVVKIHFNDDKTIIFHCEFVKTCGFDIEAIASQLQKEVIAKDFLKPSKDSYVICADGDDGDSICVHVSKDIWLLQNPLEYNMKF